MTRLLLICCLPLAGLLTASQVAPQWFQATIVQPALGWASAVDDQGLTPSPAPDHAQPARATNPPAGAAAAQPRATTTQSAMTLLQACQGRATTDLDRRRACLAFELRRQSLREQCVSSARSGQAPGLKDHNPCDQYARLLKHAQPPAKPSPSRAATPASTQRQPSPPKQAPTPRVYVNQCTQLQYGSIRYRECRAKEKQRLIDQCRRTREKLEWTVGPRRQPLRALARAQCKEADRYQIIR